MSLTLEKNLACTKVIRIPLADGRVARVRTSKKACGRKRFSADIGSNSPGYQTSFVGAEPANSMVPFGLIITSPKVNLQKHYLL